MIHYFQSHGLRIALDTYSGAVHLLDELSYEALCILDHWVKTGIWNPTDPNARDEQGGLLQETRHALVEALSTSISSIHREASQPSDPLGSLGEENPFSATCLHEKPAEMEEAISELSDLIAEGQLFSEDTFANLSLSLRDRKTYVKALCLNVAHTCNLDCDYCFASQGKYHGKRAIMSEDVAKRAIDFVIEASGPHREIDIDFFGGEPLLNWDVVKKTVAYARVKEETSGKHFRFTFTTNGMLLDSEVGDFLNQQMHNVVLSLDGRPEVHDQLRHTMDGRGSYSRIVPRFQAFVASRGDQEYYVRGTYTKNNTDFYNDIVHMANLGFYRISMEPVIGDPGEPYMLSEEDIDNLKGEYDKLTTEMIRRNRLATEWQAAGKPLETMPPEDHPFVFYHFMMNLEGGPCIHKRIFGCGSGSEYLAVTPTGDLYPCHQFVGETDFCVGNLRDGIVQEEIIGDFKECNCYSRPDCQNCWAKLYCSGGCAANALHASGSLQGTVPLSCELFRKRMECAITIQAEQALRQTE